MPYFSGQGKVFIAPIVAGVAQAFRYVGNVPALNVKLATDTVEHNESTSGQRLTDDRLVRKKSATLEFTFEEFDKNNLALALFGTAATIAAGSVTNEVLPSGLVANDYVRTQKPKISSVVVKDSAGSPATLTAGTHYSVTNTNTGTIQFVNVATFVQPFKVDYANAAVDNINMFTSAVPERWIRFEGLNTVNGDAPVLVELYKCRLDPLADLALIGDDYQKFATTGAVLYDSTKVADATLGQFGRVVLL